MPAWSSHGEKAEKKGIWEARERREEEGHNGMSEPALSIEGWMYLPPLVAGAV
jgi:hypothetical protein